ncbi:hypothetical protein DUK53_14675 [Listeria sp. SHR_NRA_18]|uniref:hypothetical protein n=1 Tax=Listeria TaxID=1637 RepID=UPI00051E05CA|nr:MULTISPECIES: hypothetical protein [Listeria]KGL43733.1 hypothetical protein EP56_07985 [Listeriaceae bacterium FSL A5-0209]KMT61749.1 hypothetical protein X559_1889 [Listeria newyorkensis]RQW65855.1 hypothetical protein DUK53_14675 [Listeria sp. SHR_NRA_18]
MKKIAMTSILLVFFVAGCSANGTTTEQKVDMTDEKTIISSSGKYTSLASSLGELENTSPIIVEVVKNDEKQTVTKESEQNTMPTEFYTMSGVTIKNIQKDDTHTLKISDKIKVMEDVATNVSIEGKKMTLTLDHYKKMEIGKSYYLYLRHSTSGDNYVLSNVFLSKYPVSKVPRNELFLAENNATRNLENMDYQDFYTDLYAKILHKNEALQQP